MLDIVLWLNAQNNEYCIRYYEIYGQISVGINKLVNIICSTQKLQELHLRANIDFALELRLTEFISCLLKTPEQNHIYPNSLL